MSEKLRLTVLRFALIFGLITLCFIGVLARIVYLQTSEIERDRCAFVLTWQERANCPIEPVRGNILDAEGRVLASSMPQYYVHIDTRVSPLHAKKDSLYRLYADSLADGLSAVVGDMTRQEYRRKMDKAFYAKKTAEKDIRLCSRSVNFLEKRQIGKLPLANKGRYTSGIYFTDLHRRQFPYGDLGSRTIGGVYGDGGKGKSGLEMYFEDYLHGTSGIATKRFIEGRWVDVPVQDARNGCDIVTTLDANLMDICDNVLRRRLERTQADWGCCILMEVKTGAVKAVCNLDKMDDGTYQEYKNHAVVRVEPGSTFKTISLMAMLDDDKVAIDDTVRVYKGGWNYGVSRHTDAHAKDTSYTVRSALAVSSNIAFAKLVTRSYERKASRFVDKLKKMGIATDFVIETPGATSPRVEVPNDAVTLSKMAYGYSVELSPMQILAFYNGIANGGKIVRPRLVERIEQDGQVIKEWHTEVLKSQMCHQSVLRDVKSALHDVVWDDELGTASVLKWKGKTLYRKAQSDVVHLAGKTGTAQMLVNGKYQSRMHRITFVGYFPEENPEYTCICMIGHPNNYPAYDAGWDCGTVVRQIAEQTMAYVGEYRWEHEQWVWRKR